MPELEGTTKLTEPLVKKCKTTDQVSVKRHVTLIHVACVSRQNDTKFSYE